MASITLKNIPDDLLGALREAAQEDRRSLNQEVMHLLSLALRRREAEPAAATSEVEAQLSAWRELAGKWESDVDRATEAEHLAQQRSRGREIDL